MSAGIQLPATLQGLLERIYDVQIRVDVADYLITDQSLADTLQGSTRGRRVSEKLLVAENGGYLELSLYLDADVLSRLRQQDPLVELHGHNLADFWLVVEGISHFIYLGWNARHDKSVTLLELEMQAEIDKFVATLQLLASQGAGDVSDALHRWLFEQTHFDSALSANSLARYRRASRYAGKYCKSLYRRFMHSVGKPGLLPELRRFYRLSQAAKIRHIESAFSAAG